MLKFHHYGAFFLSAIVTSNAFADCSSPTYLAGALRNELRNTTICYPNHQEEHRGRGRLFDYKEGRGDPVDATIQVGTWEIINNDPSPATIVYTYSKGTDTAGPFTFTPHNNDGDSITFCGSGSEITASIVRGFGSGC